MDRVHGATLLESPWVLEDQAANDDGGGLWRIPGPRWRKERIWPSCSELRTWCQPQGTRTYLVTGSAKGVGMAGRPGCHAGESILCERSAGSGRVHVYNEGSETYGGRWSGRNASAGGASADGVGNLPFAALPDRGAPSSAEPRGEMGAALGRSVAGASQSAAEMLDSARGALPTSSGRIALDLARKFTQQHPARTTPSIRVDPGVAAPTGRPGLGDFRASLNPGLRSIPSWFILDAL